MADKPLTENEKAAAAVLAAAAAAVVVDAADVRTALSAGSVAAATAAVDWTGWRTVLERYEPIIVAEYIASVTTTLNGFAWGATFDPTALARVWAYAHAGELITAVDATSREAVRALIVSAVGRGDSIPRTAAAVSSVVGLHPRYATAVDRLRARMEADGVKASVIEQRTARYSRKLLRSRAESIARWEIQDARNRGRLQVWREGLAQGALPADSMKAWDAELPTACPICVDLDGETVPVNEPFSNGRLMPPGHVRCRCTAVIVGE